MLPFIHLDVPTPRESLRTLHDILQDTLQDAGPYTLRLDGEPFLAQDPLVLELTGRPNTPLAGIHGTISAADEGEGWALELRADAWQREPPTAEAYTRLSELFFAPVLRALAELRHELTLSFEM